MEGCDASLQLRAGPARCAGHFRELQCLRVAQLGAVGGSQGRTGLLHTAGYTGGARGDLLIGGKSLSK